jgi:hypothetical protein
VAQDQNNHSQENWLELVGALVNAGASAFVWGAILYALIAASL